MITVDFLIKEFPDGDLMLLLGFREGRNFRVHKKGNTTYYTWCAHEDDLRMALKSYRAVNRFNGKDRDKPNARAKFRC